MSLITDLADAITRMEGSTRNNNPGNIWDGLTTGKATRIWPDLPIDSRGFVIYPTPEAGRAALENDLSIKVNRGMTLDGLIGMYAPPSQNDTAAYIANVSTWTGLPVGVPLNTVGTSAEPPTDESGFLDSSILGFDPSQIDWTPILVIGGLALVVWLISGKR